MGLTGNEIDKTSGALDNKDFIPKEEKFHENKSKGLDFGDVP